MNTAFCTEADCFVAQNVPAHGPSCHVSIITDAAGCVRGALMRFEPRDRRFSVVRRPGGTTKLDRLCLLAVSARATQGWRRSIVRYDATHRQMAH